MYKPSLIRMYLLFLLSLLSFTAWMPVASAYEQYSTSRNAGNCADCHGDFRNSPYISLADGVSWNNDLHDVHRTNMLNSDCNTCHLSGRFPVFLNSSVGGNGLDPISCTGCHGRAETDAGGQVTAAGLRQHHWNSGVQVCADCHSDADPAQFTAVGENVLPPYYFTPDTNHPNKPTDPCNPNGEENYAGSAIGLDNDGDIIYDQNDSDCQAVPDINLNPASLDFGAVVIGNSVSQSSQIQNLGSADLIVTDISPAAGTSAEFSVTAPATPFTIAAGGSQSVTVIYTPADVGADTGSLVISSDDPDEATVNLALSGSGEMAPTPDINLNPAALDFGSVFIGNTANLSAEVQNLGTADLTISVIDRCAGTSLEFSWTPGAPITLAAGASQTLTVSYIPADVGTDTGCLAITSNDPDEGTVELGVSGSGAAVPVADINLNPAALDFGAVVIGNSVTLSGQIENLGNADLTVTAIAPAMGTSAELSITAPATPFTIAAGGSQTVTVIYTPTDVGADTGSLVISSDDPDEPTVSLALSGSGEMAPTPDINLNPAALDFGSVSIGNTANLSAEVQNLGTAELTVSVIDRCAGTSMEFSWTPGAPITLAAGTSQILTVSYSPGDVGTDTGCLAITSNDPDEMTVELGVSGSGAAVPVADINLNPAALDFGAVVIGNSVTLSSQIENLGNADLTVTAIAPAMGTSAEFSVTAPATPFTIAAGGSQSVRVIYIPADVGADTGALVISSDDPDEPTVNLALSGSGEMAPTPDINLSPAALDFGSVFIGNTANLSTEVQNLGTANLTVSVIDRCTGTSMEFSWTPGAPITLAAGASQTLTVSYSPADVGTDSGCLAITSNDPDEASVELGLSGSGLEPGQVKEVQIKVPGAINPENKGLTPVKFFTDMDLEIMDVTCGRNDAMPKRLNSEDINDDGYLDVVGLFKTRDLGVQCGDTQLSCSGTLAGGTEFQGTSNSFKTVGKACKKDEHEDDDDDDDDNNDDDKDGERHKDDND